MHIGKKKIAYRWLIVAASFLMVFTTLGFCSSNSGIYNAAIADALGKPRSVVSLIKSFRYVATTIVNLFFGILMRKFGTKKLVAFGFFTLTASCAVFAFATELLLFYIGGLLLGLGIAFSSTTIASFIVRRWCTTNVGRYTGIVLAANGIGGAVAAQLMLPIVMSDTYGYRKAYILIIPILLVVGAVVVTVLKDNPDTPMTLELPKKKNRGSFWTGIPYETVKKRPYFYAVAVCVFLTGVLLQGISDIKGVHSRDMQIPETLITNLASVSSLILTFSKILVGMVYDRWGLRPIVGLCHGLTVTAFILIACISPTPAGIACACVSAILLTFALPLETIMIPLLTNDLFGAQSYDKLLGMFMAFNTAGFMLGAPLANITYDLWGSYVPMFLISAGLMAAVTVIFQLSAKTSQKDKDAILQATDNA